MFGTARLVLLAAYPLIEPQFGETELQCHTGPTMKHIGGNDWFLYACADGQSVVVAASAPNPATPFFFIVRPDGDGIVLYGEGTGERDATEPAYNELQAMSASDLAVLYHQAMAAGDP